MKLYLSIHTECIFFGQPALISVQDISGAERVFTIEVVLLNVAGNDYFYPLLFKGGLDHLASILGVDKIEFIHASEGGK